MTENRDDLIADLITSRALNPGLPRPEWATPSEWGEVIELADIERELRLGAEAPPLQQDRVAAMLGLIPDAAVQLDRASLTRLRKRSGLTVGQLAARLAARGWEFTQGDVFRWETSNSDSVPPAVIEAIARIVGATVSDLTVARQSPPSLLDVANPAIRALGTRLATALGIGQEMALSRLRTAADGSYHRGVRPKNDELLATLEGYVRAMERRRES